ncbi:6-bladed beta-propeller protein [Fodinibius roseus]|uniref:6-bladed beta-propeller protein n=1 Tax=Fodinibius roseus TaxID=1194090 RepID=A0A1M4SEZ5_9BACT|nr:6-bladed beta-propeller [Fodinibius roseus]SHE30834.1 6-bladed beta-propeller protein [Fodinibius roseus]
MKSIKWLISLLLIIIGCSQPDSGNPVNFTTTVVEGNSTIIDAEKDTAIVFPSFIRTAPDYFLIYEANPQKIIKFNYDGEKLQSFGSEGRGPGEFLSLTNYWIRKDHYLLYDYNGAKMIRYDFKGSLIDEYSVDISKLTMTVDVLSGSKFVYPANGTHDSLLAISDLKKGETVFFGQTIAERNETSNDMVRDIIERGEVPNYMKNSVQIGANGSGIFCFQNTKAILQKYTLEGQLQWERDLKMPMVEGVFEDFLKENKKGKYITPLTYAYGMHVMENGTALLLNTTDEKPITVSWVPNDGHDIQVVEFPSIVRPSQLPLRFRVVPGQKEILFANSMEGKIMSAEWPIN